MVFSASTAQEVWRSIGLELVIFVVTLAFALIIRTTSSKKATIKGGKGFSTPSSSPPERPAPVQRTPSQIPTAAAPRNTIRAAGANGERCQDRRGYVRDPAQIINEVVYAMREMPGTKSANKALSLYADLQANFKDIRILDVARRSNHSPDEFFTTLVQCAIRVGKYHLVDGLLDDMIKQGVCRPLAFYESAMKQLAGQKHYHMALSMYDRLVADGLEPSAVTCSCLISFAAEVGELQRAIRFFEKLSSITTPSIRAYMTVLRVHAKRQDWPSSVATFRDMQRRGVPLDSLVLNVILATGVAADQIEPVEELLIEADNFKPPISDVVSYNTLIKGYAQRNDSAKAMQVIKRMRHRGLVTNAITFNTAMDAAVRSMRCGDAWELLQEMRKCGFRPDKFTCSILVKGLAKSPVADHVRMTLDLLHEVDATCDATLRSTLYHSVLEAAAQANDTSVLMLTFNQMRQHQVMLTANAYRLLVQVLGQEGDVARCNQIWQQMLSEDIRPQATIFVALLESHLKQGQVDGALKAFDSLRTSIKGDGGGKRRVDGTSLLEECRVAFIRSLCRISREPEATHIYLQARTDGTLANIDSATGMMLARVQADCGNLSHAWMTIEDIIGLGHKPNEATLHSFLSACIKQSHTLYAKSLIQKSASNNICFSQATYALLLKLFGRCQQLQDALLVFHEMTEKHGIEPSSQTVVALLRSCFQCRQPGRGLELVEKLQARAGALPLDGAIYSTAFTGCATAGLVPKGLALVEEALNRGAILPPDALQALAATAGRRGQVGEADLRRLQELAESHGLSLSPNDSPREAEARDP